MGNGNTSVIPMNMIMIDQTIPVEVSEQIVSGAKYVVQAQLLDTSSNGKATAREGKAYVATLTPASGLTIDSVIVSMGGTDITASAWDSGTSKITIENVTGDIVIVASAVTTPDNITLTDVDSSYRTKLEDVVDLVNDGGLYDAYFCVITDPHSSNPSTNKSQNIARYLLKNSKANKLFLLGDYCDINWSNAQWESFSAPFADCIPKVYVTLGNHEYFGGSATDRAAIVAEYLTPKTYLHGFLSDFYYYFDDTIHKIRYIVLNTSDGSTNNVSATQLTWLNSAVQVPSADWGIIVMGHFPLYRNTTETSENVSNERYDIRDAFMSTNGTLIAYICGHTHSEITGILDYSFYQVICNNDSGGKTICYVFGVNTEDKTLDILHVGSVGTDATIDYDDIPTMVTRTITNTLTGCTTSNSAQSIINGRPYSATLTAETNYDLDQGTVSITMGGTDITSTAYNSSTHAISISQVTGDVVVTATALYVAPLTEFTASWFTKTNEKKIDFPANMGNVDSEFPSYFCVIGTNGTTSYPTGYRQNTKACYQSRTNGYVQSYWNLIDAANNPPTGASTVAFTATTLPHVTKNGKAYTYHTFTRADHNAAWAARVASIEGGKIASGGGIVINNKTSAVGADLWVIAENVTADNIYDIIPRLPAHLLAIVATFTQGDHVVYTTDSLDSLKPYLTVQERWTYNVLEDVADTDYTLSGTLTEGSSTITVTHEGLTATFTVTVTAA